MILKGLSNGTGKIIIEQTLITELYRDFPTTAIMYAAFKNVSGSQIMTMDTTYSSCYQLDASLTDPGLSPHSFYTFYGTAGRPVRQLEKILPKDLKIDTYSGRRESLEGIKRGNGGIPIVDIWCKQMGVGIGHIERKWQNVYFPIEVQKDGKVFIAVKEIPAQRDGRSVCLKSGKLYHTPKTFVNVHHLDFYATLKTYSELMKS